MKLERPPGQWVTLTEDEARMAARVGFERRLGHFMQATRPTKGAPADPWEVDILGAVAEYAVARHLNLCWIGVTGGFRELPGDVGHGGIEVRSTPHPRGRLLIHPRDHDNRAYVLALTKWAPRHVRLVGWLYGKDAKREEFFDSGMPRPTYAVPWEALQPLTDVPTKGLEVAA